MIAEYGVHGVSIRQIAKASRSANSSVVAYHFGNKEALLQAVINHRLPAIDQRRNELLATVKRSNIDPQISDLIEALYRPFFEQRNAAGRRSYAAFVDELSRANLIDIRTSLDSDYPVTAQILDEILSRLKGDAIKNFGHRIFLSSALIFAAIKQIDQMELENDEGESQFVDALAAATSVIEAKKQARRANSAM
jgi:AcrR family transcriptional regulator